MSWSQIQNLLESRLLREREKWVVYWCMILPLSLIFSSSLSISLLAFLIFFLFLSFFCVPSLLSAMHIYGHLYYLLWQDLPFLPYKYFWLVVGVLPGLLTGLPAAQPPPLHCVGHAMPHSQTKVVFVLFSTSFCISIWIRVRFLSYQPL